MNQIKNINIFECIHKHWIDEKYINWDTEKFNRIGSPKQNGEILFDGNKLDLKWYKLPVETLTYDSDNDMFINEYFKIIHFVHCRIIVNLKFPKLFIKF